MNQHNKKDGKQPLCGIVPPLITPVLGRDELDVAGLERLIEHVINGGVHGVFILGTTGEAPCLSYRLRREVIDRACKFVRGRVPVIVGITDTAMVEAVNLAKHAATAGAQAVVSAAPYYFTATQPELLVWAQHLLQKLPLPMYLYNMPEMTKVQFDPALIKQLVQLEGIIGFKDSSGDLNYFQKVVDIARTRLDWRVFVGPEHLLVETLRMGGHGGVNGGAQVDPNLLVGLYDATLRDDRVLVEQLKARLLELKKIYEVGHYASSVINGIKCATNLMGICSGEMVEPMSTFNQTERGIVAKKLTSLGVLPARSVAEADGVLL